MSEDRIPPTVGKMMMTLHYQDGFCTVQAIWDEVEIVRLLAKGNCTHLMKHPRFDVYVRRAVNSQKITKELSKEIAKRWLKGNYVRVQSALIGDMPSIEWLS